VPSIRNRSWIWFALAIIWMAVIFIKSAEPYTKQDMRGTLANLIAEDTLTKLMPQGTFSYDDQLVTSEKPYDMLEFYIRKFGHMFSFGLLAILWAAGLRSKLKSRSMAMLAASIISLLYAISDEWHQTFVPNRTGHAIDVAVDAAGILLAMAGYALILWLRDRRSLHGAK